MNDFLANDCLPGGVSSGGGVNWPMAIFWAVALGGPYIIYKCISRMVSQMEEKRKWATGAGEHYNAQVITGWPRKNWIFAIFRAIF